MRTHILLSIGSAVVLLSACGRSTPEQPSDSSVDMPSILTHGSNSSVAYGAMEATGNTGVNGIVVVHHTGDRTGTVTFQINIEPAVSGSHYEAWVSNSKTGEELRLGQLENPANDTRHALRYEAAQSLAGYDSARITLQKDGAVAEGEVVATAKMETSAQ